MSWMIFFAVLFGTLVGIAGERLRLRWEWLEKRTRYRPRTIRDSADQLRAVSAAEFKPRKLMSHKEARVFYAVERIVAARGSRCRVMAQVNLGEILSCPDRAAFSAVNSKRVDILVISPSGDPLAAIEYQGSGHYQGDAPARDAVKREALRRAGVAYIEVVEGDAEAELLQRLARIIPREEPKRAA